MEIAFLAELHVQYDISLYRAQKLSLLVLENCYWHTTQTRVYSYAWTRVINVCGYRF